jgi:outer membrane lipoprotein-sorting protein
MKKNKVVAFAAALAVAVSSASAIAPASANTTLKAHLQDLKHKQVLTEFAA